MGLIEVDISAEDDVGEEGVGVVHAGEESHGEGDGGWGCAKGLDDAASSEAVARETRYDDLRQGLRESRGEGEAGCFERAEERVAELERRRRMRVIADGDGGGDGGGGGGGGRFVEMVMVVIGPYAGGETASVAEGEEEVVEIARRWSARSSGFNTHLAFFDPKDCIFINGTREGPADSENGWEN